LAPVFITLKGLIMLPFFDRRGFLKGTAGLAAAGLLDTHAQAAPDDQPAPAGANNRLNVAVIGVNGRGKNHLDAFAGNHNCVVTHICDVDSRVAASQVQRITKKQGVAPQYVQDLRRIMDDKSIHVVSIATPNHWHALAAIWAMQAGKDVYVEKPVSHNVSEGRRIVEVARRTNKLCQTGTQSRSSIAIAQAMEFLKSGQIGKLKVARGLCYKLRPSIGHGQGEIPKTVDYDLWCGPAPNRPLNRLRLHYDWHWQWDYGNGDLGNQGIHQMDIARRGIGRNEMPRSVMSLGGRFGYVDDGETANTQICVFDYGDAELIFEVRGLQTDAYRTAKVGNVFHCADGYIVISDRYGAAIAYGNNGDVIRRFNGSNDHFLNFITAVRSRRREDLKADILEGHLSSALCHLGNISYRMGRPTAFNASSHAFGDDRDAAETLGRMEQHLRDNRIPLEKTTYLLGPKLMIDNKTESFGNNTEANRYLTREYRKGFVVPARV
jgi:predicted dehydrogenase